MDNLNSLATNADLIIAELRRNGLPPVLKGKINKFTFRSLLATNLLIFTYLACGFIGTLITPAVAAEVDMAAFRENFWATVIVVAVGVVLISVALSLLTIRISDRIINTERLESDSQLNEIKSKVTLGERIASLANESSLEVVEAYIKSKIDWLNDKISFLTVMTLIGAFLTGTMSFLEVNDSASKFAGSCAVWVMVLVRLDATARLYVFRDWMVTVATAKALVKPEQSAKSRENLLQMLIQKFAENESKKGE